MLRDENVRGTDLGIASDKLSKQGMLLPDETIVALVDSWLRKRDGRFIFDGFPRTVGQAESLDALLETRQTPLGVALALDASTETLQRRVSQRVACSVCGFIGGLGLDVASLADPCPQCGGTLGRRADDTPEALAVRLSEYKEKTSPLLDYYGRRNLLKTIASEGTPEAVFASIVAVLEGA